MKNPRSESLALIGFRGTGKSTVARLLAAKLDWSWIDADEYLEQKHGRSIREIFATSGERSFRDMEAAIVQELHIMPRLVLATGGGVVLRSENRRLLKRMGGVVWLTASADSIGQRLRADAATVDQRPALTDLGEREEIEQLLILREPFYRDCANWIIDTTTRSPEEVVALILTFRERD